MGLECAILFGHYQDNLIVRHHLAILRSANSFPVIPICFDFTGLEGAVAVGRAANPWHDCDLLIYQWFKIRSVEAQRYIYFDWDCLATMPLREYYSTVWNADAAAKAFFTPVLTERWKQFP